MNGKAAVLIGSESDRETMESANPYYEYFNIPFKIKVLSAHRTPVEVHKFSSNAKENGYRIKEFIEFSDHHNYTERDIENLFNRAYDQQATLITTEKDYMRLPPFAKKDEISVLSIDMEFKEPEKILSFLKDKLNNLNN